MLSTDGVLSLKAGFNQTKHASYDEASTTDAEMPPVFIEDKELQKKKSLKYLGLTFDRSLCGNLHISRTIMKARKVWLPSKQQLQQACLKRSSTHSIKQLSVINYGFGLLTLS